MGVKLRYFMGSAEEIGDDEVGVVCLTSGVKRDGHEWVPSGVELTEYRANPIVLANHDPTTPVGTAVAIGITNGELGARIRFAPAGISAKADETRGLVKSGVLSGISAGIDPIEIEPLDPNHPRAGSRVLRCKLLELSFVAIPADPSARVTQRSASRAAMYRGLDAIPAVAIERSLQAQRIGRAATPGRPFFALAAALDGLAGRSRRLPRDTRNGGASRETNFSSDPLAEIAWCEYGERLTPSQVETIKLQARHCGRAPEFHLRWLRMATREVNRGVDDYLRRQQDLKDLEREP